MIEILDIRQQENFSKVVLREVEDMTAVTKAVEDILIDVKLNGDSALREYTARFDGAEIADIEVTGEEIGNALKQTDKEMLEIFHKAAKNITDYHKEQIYEGYTLEKEGIIMGQRINAIENVGIYIPGGTAAYPSTVLMDVIPARLAGVSNIYIATPPRKDGSVDSAVLAAANIAQANRVFKVGGAQAIAAFCYGTETIPKVDLIVGPGNIYVSAAKKILYGTVGIDMIAGPSDVLIIADDTANAKYIAADMLSQAEHDENSSSILISISEAVAKEVIKNLNQQLPLLTRSSIAKASIKNNGRIFLVKDISSAIELTNHIAPEHLEIQTQDPFTVMQKINNAASIFLGSYTPEAIGDYYAGPNHTLPTLRSARFASPLSVDSFRKKSSFLGYSKQAFEKDALAVEAFALFEGLTAHANSIKVRRNESVEISE